jgi:TRAP-type C4-dicarboxylate transport system permease small subunit
VSRFLFSAPRSLASIAGWLSGLSLVSIFVIGMSNVFGRYTGTFSILWSADLQRLLFIWAVFLGTAAAHHSESHLAIDYLRDRFPPQIRRIAVVVSHLLLLVLLGVLMVYGWEVTMLRRNVPYVQLGISHSYAFAALPISAALMVLFTIEAIVRDLRGRPSEDKGSAESLM